MATPPSFIPEQATQGEAAQGGAPPSFQPETPEEANQREFGGVGGQIETGVGSFLDTVTLGGATQLAMQGSKNPTELARRIRGQEEANPGSKMIGMAGGVILPAVLSGGTSAAAGLAEASAPSLITKAGSLAARGVEAVLPKATTALGKAGVKAASTFAQGAAEGALYGAGNVVHEEALGDPALTAQSALEEVGLTAFLGGGLGAAGGILGSLAKGVTGGKLGQKIAEWLPEFEGQRNLKAAGAIQSDISSAAKRMSREELNAIGREAGELGLVGKFSTPARTLEKSEALMESAGNRMGEILDAADGMPGVAPKPMAQIAARVRKEVVAKLETNPLEAGTAKQMGEFLNGYEARFAQEGAPELGFKELHGIRKQIDAKLYGLRGTADPQATAIKDALHDFRGIVSDEIEKGLDATTLRSASWKEASREYRVASTIGKLAEKGVDRAVGNNLVSPMETLSGLAGMASGNLPLGLLMGAGTAAVRRFGSGIMGEAARVVRQSESLGAIGQLAKANQEVGKRVTELAGSVIGGGRRIAAPRIAHELLSERMEQVQRFASDPLHAQDTLAQGTDSLQEHAPQVAQAVQVAAARAAGYLASKVPQQKMTPLGKPLQTSAQQKWEFGRHYEAVNKPTVILEHAAAGTLTPLDVEAVRTVYPQLFEQMQAAALDKVMGHKGVMPYRTRLMLGMLLGQDLDGTMSSEAIQANQAVYQRPTAKSGEDMAAPRPKTTQTGLSKLKASNRAMTPTQSMDRNLEAG